MKLSEWAKQQGVAYQTAWRWFKAGKLPVPAERTPSGTILVSPERFSASNEASIYCRVSSHDKKGDLDRQVERCLEFCRSRGWAVDLVVKEIASGMNDSRPRLRKLLASSPSRIVVEHKDRLTRFGFRYFEDMLPRIGCELVVMNRDSEEKDDLLKDLVAVVTSFCCRLYGLRRGQKKAKEIKESLP
jgi:predicted site-specific integrase-resolvase